MPTQTFFNLSEDKKKRLMDAASVEFSRVPFNEASINNIIKLAGVSRGSFYQYFEDKEDLYFYCFSSLKQDSQKMLKECLIEADGDLLLGYQNYFPKMLELLTKNTHVAFFKNMFLHMDYRTSREVSPEVMRKREVAKKNHESHFSEFVNMEELDVDSAEEFHMLIRLMMSMLFQTIGEIFAKESSPEEATKNFNKKIAWLRNGLYLKK